GGRGWGVGRRGAVYSWPRGLAGGVPAGGAGAFAAAIAEPAPLALRANLARVARPALAERLARERPGADIVLPADPPEALIVRGAGSPEAPGAVPEGPPTRPDAAAPPGGRRGRAPPGDALTDA